MIIDYNGPVLTIRDQHGTLIGGYILPSADEAKERAGVLTEALTWQGTKFHDCGNIKGVGTDCGNMPFQVYHNQKLIDHMEIPAYHPQFMLHSKEELFLSVVERQATWVQDEPLPADLIMWKFGRCFSHSGIVMSWPVVLHADKEANGVILDNALSNARLVTFPRWEGRGPRPRRVYRLNRWIRS